MKKMIPNQQEIDQFGILKKELHYKQDTTHSTVNFKLPFPISGWHDQLHKYFSSAFTDEFEMSLQQTIPDNSKPSDGASRVKNIIAVTSTKGGVGKSAIAINLAQTLNVMGAKVGLADLDVYGPSLLSSLQGAPIPALKITKKNDKQLVTPSEWQGVRIMSISMSIASGQAIPWRGPMASNVALQILQQTQWGELDFLIVDMPPGTGDIPLTITKQLPPTTSISVTTPHSFAIEDTARGMQLFKQLKIPTAGLIVNMAWFICPDCGSAHKIFGDRLLQDFARENKVLLLATLPLAEELNGYWNKLFPDQRVPTEMNQVQKDFISIATKLCLHLDDIRVNNKSIKKITLQNID